jgi:hypothetical protein
MKDMVHALVLINREMMRFSALAKIDNSAKNKQYKSLHDNYTKARARQYQQIRKTVRTKHK